MRQRIISRKRRQAGFSVIELLIAVLITGIIAAAAFQFYVTMNQNVVTQQEISEMQATCRACLQEMSRSLRVAGYLLETVSPHHPPYEINGDTLWVYSACDSTPCPDPIDTTVYFLSEFSETDYDGVPGRPESMQIYKFMLKRDTAEVALYADFVQSIMFTPIGTDSAEMAITMIVQASRADDTFEDNDGFRTFSNTERVSMRNVTMH